ncbi:MAG TPA: DUF4382 domain-containing protein [Gemmatimonadales bacterium]|nr:DUF4382 domain-containing protein [Gemmatimonadales bacterium]
MRYAGLALALAALAACDSSEIGPGSNGDGKTSVLLTDAPFPFDQVSRVDIHVREIALSTSLDTSDGAPEWVVVSSPDRLFNLLDLQNGSTALLGEAEVPPGDYRAVRLVFDPTRSTITLADGEVLGTAAGPGDPGVSWQAKGDRPSLFALVEEAMAIGADGEDVVVDFDVGRSFLYDGGKHFTFIPFLRAITRSGSGALHGRLIRESDQGPIEDAVVSVHLARDSTAQLGPLLATTRAAADGEFTASFLRPGRYQLVAEDLERSTTTVSEVVEVAAGRTTEVGEIEF